ncbi:ATP-binding SpoIIE family protein phosphatase [Sulfurimonas paralvinellae]|uniref:SpoIIE family protein phosphatase n=1 Tax=Sulfurimonas paralvinellae TaxID=317658 RepID=A0A7M1B5H9_9BACT|nr:SpoIIE family protein phosphatase [Sulfurimonas paralvinellae]QOP44905.1 SpoIIE family protein phosphatase [Sulfurimonas paralvinellae]
MSKERLEQLEKSEAYASYQSDLAFAKELNILRNDFYYQMIDSNAATLVDFLYKPLDTLSGDAYSARRIDEHRTFYLLVDGMGKGVSASFTAVIMTTFINHLVDKMIEHDSFSLDLIVKESMEFIKPILLDDEVLAIDYICFDNYYDVLEYAKFAMPPFLLQDKDDNIIRIKANNTPLSKWQSKYDIARHNVANIEKFLFYSDGIVENTTDCEGLPYAAFIEDDFRESFSREEFKEKFFNKVKEQEDDLTLIFINSLDIREETLVAKHSFKTSLADVDAASQWYETLWGNIQTDNSSEAEKAGVVFTELYMNAYEHGNLGISAKEKHQYLEDDVYFEKLNELEQMSTKNIIVEVYMLKEFANEYVVTKIKDEGDGFDTQILSQIFRNSRKFNGRGVFISRKNSMGIYYNSQGNCVLFFNKI